MVNTEVCGTSNSGSIPDGHPKYDARFLRALSYLWCLSMPTAIYGRIRYG